ncbi:glutathione S-transferase [Parvibaculum indicum]|uniref:glutathione S-transferase family protein n=1 Tax=Parvibaculum indicum TaxID=562969 RepID=UPI001422C79D|nr:glutathione S-transferase family protein [Parvibaculum indicum]NIJ41788.1 glutathione S-transferase [Parvibaculum indicum]
MQMYNAQLSPYSARCRIAIQAKGLDVELLPISDDAVKARLAALTPMHKVPTLIDGDHVIPESDVICEYFEEKGEGPALLPADPAARAQVRLLARIGEIYVMEPMGDLFDQIDPRTRDKNLVARAMGEVVEGMGWLDSYLDGSAYAVGAALSFADCALVPILFFFERLGPMFGEEKPLQAYPRVASYYKAMHDDPHCGHVLAEMDVALKQFMGI